MEERKLKLLLPGARNLINPKRWSVRNVLDLAGIGTYSEGNHFNSRDPEIEGIILRPKVVADYVAQGIFEAAITGVDVIENSWFSRIRTLKRGWKLFSYEMPKEVCDLGCGYVDLDFLTTPKEWNSSLEYWEKMKDSWPKNLPAPSNLEKILCYYHSLDGGDPNKELKEIFPCFCLTPYHYSFLAKEFARKVVFLKKKGAPIHTFEVWDSPSVEEDLAFRANNFDIMGFGLEAVATGNTLRRNNLVAIQTLMNSSARLYLSFEDIKGAQTVTDETSYSSWKEQMNWKKAKSQELQERIEAVTKDIGEHCQVRLTFENVPEIYQHRNFMNILKRHGINEVMSPSCGPICFNDLKDGGSAFKKFPEINFVIPKSSLPNAQGFLCDIVEKGTDEVNHAQGVRESERVNRGELIRSLRVECFSLNSLYAYCPLYLHPMKDLSSSTGHVKIGKYPCADSTKLRPEHREQAILYELPKH